MKDIDIALTPSLIDEERFSVLEFAKRAKIGKSKAFSLVSEQKIASLKVGNKIWITKSAANVYLAKCERPAVDDDGHKGKVIEKIARRKNGLKA